MRLSELIAQEPSLDIDLDVEPNDIVTDVIALLRVQRLTSTDDALIIGATDTTGGIVQYGIVRAAVLQVEDWMVNPTDDD